MGDMAVILYMDDFYDLYLSFCEITPSPKVKELITERSTLAQVKALCQMVPLGPMWLKMLYYMTSSAKVALLH